MINDQHFHLKGVFQALCNFLASWRNSPLKLPIPVPRKLVESIQEAVSETKQYWEDRYSEVLLQSTDSPMGTLSRRTLLDQYGGFLRGTIEHLAQLEKSLLADGAQIMIPYGQLRSDKWRLLGYLKYRAAFG